MDGQRGVNPYVAGALAGLVMILSVVFAGKYYGASTSFVRTAGMIEKFFVPEHVAMSEYFSKKVPHVDWQWMFVAGILIGAFVMSRIRKDFEFTSVPPMWKERFGGSMFKRAVFAFIGGFVLIFGARVAGGCPSGHGLSGIAQLSLGSIIATVCFFIGGVITSNIIYRRRRA